jgi:hypothetical protein
LKTYIEKPLPQNLLNIGAAARRARISGQRFRRAVKLLKIPVYRSGWSVMIEEKQIDRVKKAFVEGVIRRGRPPKKKA